MKTKPFQQTFPSQASSSWQKLSSKQDTKIETLDTIETHSSQKHNIYYLCKLRSKKY